MNARLERMAKKALQKSIRIIFLIGLTDNPEMQEFFCPKCKRFTGEVKYNGPKAVHVCINCDAFWDASG